MVNREEQPGQSMMNDRHPPSRGHPHLALCPTLIGRDAELSTLVEMLARAQRGEGTVAFILGEAGIGKSRLVRELATAARQRGFSVLTGRAVQSSSPVPLRPLASVLLQPTCMPRGASARRWNNS